MEQNEDCLDDIEMKGNKLSREFLINKKLEHSFPTRFEDVRQKRKLISLVSKTDQAILKQSEFTGHERNIIIKSLALEKLQGRRALK